MRSGWLLTAVILGTAVVIQGCATYTSDGRTVFGGRQTRQPQGPTPEQAAVMRRDTRIAELENLTRRQRGELEEVNSSISSLSARTDDFTRQMDVRSSDVVALRTEAAALRRDVDALKAKIDAVPVSFSKMLEEQRRVIMAEVDRSVKTSIANIPKSRSSSGGSTSSGKFYEHEVQNGQTLSEIARVYEVSMEEIKRENNIKDGSLIRVGQKLLIPAK